ncbi:MAG: acyl-CoA dehydratase activase [Anaerolineales bacterium]|jgi:predicted CoA-substrate-specific enzyme activase
MSQLHAIGIDVGSATVKLVGTDHQGQLTWQLLEQTHPRIEEQVARLLDQTRAENEYPADIPIIATGYGRKLVSQSTRVVTEITCHARGIYRELGHGGTLVDIGGQDSKVIRISPDGKVIDFAMNDKCAAGTGRFLENTAQRLAVPLEKMGELALGTPEEVAISSTCTVFAESEIISLIAHGIPVPNILRGLHRSLIQRIVAMVNSVGFEPPLMLSGGVVQNPLIATMFMEELNTAVTLPQYPQLMGALGAALIALDA